MSEPELDRWRGWRKRTSAKPPARARPRGGMNKLEADYASLLEQYKHAGHILDWRYEAVRLRLADKTFYTPDFLVVGPLARLEFHETKGFMREAARVRIRVAAGLYPWFRFVIIRRGPGGKWLVEEVPA